MVFQVCPQHADEEVEGLMVSAEVGWEFTCPRSNHVRPGPYTWLTAPPAPPHSGLSGLAEDLGLRDEIPAVLNEFAGQWVEYGVFERAYALSHPDDWTFLIDRYGHTAIAAKPFSVSAFLAGTLGHLARQQVVVLHMGPATGRWAYNGRISWWTLPPGPDWEARLSWADSGFTVDYVPGQTEV